MEVQAVAGNLRDLDSGKAELSSRDNPPTPKGNTGLSQLERVLQGRDQGAAETLRCTGELQTAAAMQLRAPALPRVRSPRQGEQT